MTTLHRIAGMTAAVALVSALAWLSQVPIAQAGASGGLLRLAWRARPQRLEACQEQSADALAALPAHMRSARICTGASASYRLVVTRDGVVLDDRVVEAGGLRGDRPIYVFREIAVPAVAGDFTVSFVRVEPEPEPAGSQAPGSATDRTDDATLLTEALPADVRFTARLDFDAGQVRLLSYDPTRQRLFEVQPGRP